MPRGQSPFRGDYVVPESKVPEILMAGADAQAKQIEQGFAVAGQAIEQLGLNKKQQETDKATIKSALNMVDVVERNDPNKDDQKVSSYYEGMRTALNNENTPLHGRATFANNTLANFTLTSQLKSQQLNQSAQELTNRLSVDLHDTKVEKGKIENTLTKSQADLVAEQALTQKQTTKISEAQAILAGLEAEMMSTVQGQNKYKIAAAKLKEILGAGELAEAKAEQVKATTATIAPESAAKISQMDALAAQANATAAASRASTPTDRKTAQADLEALTTTLGPTSHYSYSIKNLGGGKGWVVEVTGEEGEKFPVGSKEHSEMVKRNIEETGAIEALTVIDYEVAGPGGDPTSVNYELYSQFQDRYEQYLSMIATGSDQSDATELTGIRLAEDHNYAIEGQRVEWNFEGAAAPGATHTGSYQIYLKPLDQLEKSVEPHEEELYNTLTRYRSNLNFYKTSLDPAVEQEIAGEEPSGGAKKLN